MQNKTLTSLALAAVFALGACAPADDAAKVRAEIEAGAAAWEAAFNAGDAAAVAALYAEDAHLMAPGMEAITGRETIGAFWQSAMDAGLAAVDLVTEEVYAGQGTATEVGLAVIFDAQGNSPGSSKYIVVWKKTDQGWRIHRDIWNENQTYTPPEMPEGGANPGT